MKKQSRVVSQATKSAIATYLNQCAKFKNAYFWSGFGNSSARAWREAQEAFSYSGDGIELDFSINLSRNNCYVSKSVVIDGRKTTAAALKKFIA